MRLRLRSESGFGLIELLMAIVLLNVGILAIVAAFNAGIVSLNRASRISTGACARRRPDGALPRAHLRRDRARLIDDPEHGAVHDRRGLLGHPGDGDLQRLAEAQRVQREPVRRRPGPQEVPRSTPTSSSPPASTTPPTPTGGRQLKIVTVVVRDGNNLYARPYAREASTFDQSTGS